MTTMRVWSLAKMTRQTIGASLFSGYLAHRWSTRRSNNAIICFKFSSSSTIDVHMSSSMEVATTTWSVLI
uniref:Uncharacterized protein n=1 Tax=Arundo donax TaxID=35708 RepID=A0A0A9C3C4_ARUDO